MRQSLETELGWMDLGTALCERALASIDDDGLRGPSSLAGWSRAHVVAHLDGNARALLNLVIWARTGVETPMYASPEQRNADISAGTKLPAGELRARFAESAQQLREGLTELDASQWAASIRTIQGRTLPASEIPWLRSREVLVHAYDLLGGVQFDELPPEFLSALIDEVVERRATLENHPRIDLTSGETHRWEIPGAGVREVVTGSLPQIAAYVTGRQPLGPELPPWL